MTFSFTSLELEKNIDALLKRFPFINCAVIGRSRLGKPIYALEITNGNSGAKKIFLNSAHHANEWLTSPLLLNYLADSAERLSQSCADFYFVPMVNPDGVDLVAGGIKSGSEAYEYARSMCRPGEIFPSCWKANAAGVDLNSNYPAGWWAFKKFKQTRSVNEFPFLFRDAPGSREYVGPYPLSEPESAALVSYTRANDFNVTLSFHTQGEVIYWRYRHYRPPAAEKLAQKISKASGYVCEDVPDESGHAGYKDWFIQEFDRPGFTVECGFGENPLSVKQFGKMRGEASAIINLFTDEAV